ACGDPGAGHRPAVADPRLPAHRDLGRAGHRLRLRQRGSGPDGGSLTVSIRAIDEDALAGHTHTRAQERFLARSVALVGFMGVGKTSVGSALAALMDRPFLDTDVLVETWA